MIQSTEIRKIARKTGLPAGLIEKDYANTLILKEVYQHGLTKDMLVFKKRSIPMHSDTRVHHISLNILPSSR